MKIGDDYAGGKIFHVCFGGKTCFVVAYDEIEDATWEDAKLACVSYRGGGYDNWRMPSIAELNLLYTHRDIIGGFSEVGYWSADQYTEHGAWALCFENGYQFPAIKMAGFNVQAVRKAVMS